MLIDRKLLLKIDRSGGQRQVKPMRCITALVGAAIAAVLFSAAHAGPISRSPSDVQNDNIEIAYRAPDNPSLRPIYDRLVQLGVLEEFRQFMAPLRLPRTLTVQTDQCNGAVRPYQPGGSVTVCYELLEQIRRIATTVDAPTQEETIIVGTFIQVLLQEVAHAVFDLLQVPIWGRVEDAADNLAAFIMVQFGDDLARKTIRGSTDFFLLSGKTWTGSDFASVMSPDRQRYYNYLCMAYGSDPKTFEFLVKAADGAPPVLPPQRAKSCDQEYETFRTFFDLRIMPYIDPDSLVIVRSMQWRTP
jgi:putative metallopeptidase DUF4344